MDRLILDTGVLIAAVRGRATISDDSDIALPAIVIAEYLAGVELDSDAGRKAAQRSFLSDVLAVIPVCIYDTEVAAHHAELLAHTRRDGRRRGPHDLIIAATARSTNRTILTTDGKAGFNELPSVTARLIGTQ